MKQGVRALAVCALALAAGQAGAQTAYKCTTRNGVTYSQVPCPGAREVGTAHAKSSDRNAVPSQDRARRVQRQSLTPEKREECNALDKTLADEKAALDQLPQPPTPAQEKNFLNAKIRYGKLHC
jgi:hypothetical protein